MGKDVTEKLVFVPATTKVVEHHRLKYACRGCEQNGTRNTIKQAPPAPSILPKSYATPSLLSQLIISKYQHGLPLYRQEVIFKQLGIQLCRQTMSDWLIKIANVLHPILYEYWHKILLTQDVVKADETPLKVINDDNIKSYIGCTVVGQIHLQIICKATVRQILSCMITSPRGRESVQWTFYKMLIPIITQAIINHMPP
jgi:transposase